MAWVAGLLVAALSAAASEYNTEQTAKRQDNQAAQGLIEQGRKQKQADAKVNDEVTKLQGSNSSDERATALQNYMSTLAHSRQTATAGLTPDVGGAAFKADATKAQGDVQANAADTAGLMSRIDAPGMQRQGEGFDYGNLATDLSLISRQAQGDDFLNQLRIRAIRRNPWIDGAAAGMSGYASGMGGGASAASSGASAYGPYKGGYQYPATQTGYGTTMPKWG